MSRTQDEIAKWAKDHGELKMSFSQEMDATIWMLIPIAEENEQLRQAIKMGRGVTSKRFQEERQRIIKTYKIRAKLLRLICADTREHAQRLAKVCLG